MDISLEGTVADLLVTVAPLGLSETDKTAMRSALRAAFSAGESHGIQKAAAVWFQTGKVTA